MKSVMPELITVEELAFALKKTVKSIRSDATRNPKCLPPRCRLPGNKRLLWRREDVKDWIDKSLGRNRTHFSGKDKKSFTCQTSTF